MHGLTYRHRTISAKKAVPLQLDQNWPLLRPLWRVSPSVPSEGQHRNCELQGPFRSWLPQSPEVWPSSNSMMPTLDSNLPFARSSPVYMRSSKLQEVGIWMWEDVCWFSLFLGFGVRGTSCSNLLATTVYYENSESLCICGHARFHQQ